MKIINKNLWRSLKNIETHMKHKKSWRNPVGILQEPKENHIKIKENDGKHTHMKILKNKHMKIIDKHRTTYETHKHTYGNPFGILQEIILKTYEGHRKAFTNLWTTYTNPIGIL